MNTIGNSFIDYSSLFNSSAASGYSSNSGYQALNSLNSLYGGYGYNISSLSASATNKTLEFLGSAEKINSSLSKLLGEKNDGSSIFGSTKAVSSDTDLLTAAYKSDVDKYSSAALAARRDKKYTASAPKDLAIKAVQLATTQENTGNALKAKELSFEKNGSYTFEINDGNKSSKISFSVGANDTNESVQKKIADAINEKNIGVKATITSNGMTGTNTLHLESRETGVNDGMERAFEISDIKGNAASLAGLNNMTESAQNAIYYVGDLDSANSTKTGAAVKGDAVMHTSKSNTVSIDDRTTVTLKQKSDNYTALKFEKDSSEAIDTVRDLVNNFNALYEAARSNSSANASSGRLAVQLSGLINTYSSSLADVGITTNESGYLKIDEKKMQEAADNGKLESVFGSDENKNGYGFASRLESISKSVSSNPARYAVSSPERGSADSGNIWDFDSAGVTPNYSMLFKMNNYDQLGLLFNSVF